MIVWRLAFRKVPISGAPSLPPPPLRLISLRRCRRAAHHVHLLLRRTIWHPTSRPVSDCGADRRISLVDVCTSAKEQMYNACVIFTSCYVKGCPAPTHLVQVYTALHEQVHDVHISPFGPH